MGIHDMKTLTKVVLGGAVLAGAASAHAGSLPVPQASTDASDLIFVLQNVSTGATYDLVLNQTVGNGTGSYFNTTDAKTAGPVQGTTVGTIFNETGFTVSLSGDTALSSFLASAGTNINWGIYGGAYTGALPASREVQGTTLVVTTGTNASVLQVGASNFGSVFATDLGTDIKGINAGPALDTFGGQTPGYMGSSGTVNASLNLYGTGVVQGSTSLGSTLSLYGLTGNGSASGQTLAYLLGSVTFTGTALTFTPITSVPIPAAGWLFGSGLLGLLGISRRRREAVAA
jgi:hypothetical protein